MVTGWQARFAFVQIVCSAAKEIHNMLYMQLSFMLKGFSMQCNGGARR
jgi:hypothetical protein